MKCLPFLVVLSTGALNAIALPLSVHAEKVPVKWCSIGFGSPAEFSSYSQGTGGMLLKIVGRPDEWFDNEAGELTSAEIVVWVEGVAEPQKHVWIIRDRVFWPCEYIDQP